MQFGQLHSSLHGTGLKQPETDLVRTALGQLNGHSYLLSLLEWICTVRHSPRALFIWSPYWYIYRFTVHRDSPYPLSTDSQIMRKLFNKNRGKSLPVRRESEPVDRPADVIPPVPPAPPVHPAPLTSAVMTEEPESEPDFSIEQLVFMLSRAVGADKGLIAR